MKSLGSFYIIISDIFSSCVAIHTAADKYVFRAGSHDHVPQGKVAFGLAQVSFLFSHGSFRWIFQVYRSLNWCKILDSSSPY